MKTKVRNRMSLKMLASILRIRTTLIVSGKCYKDLAITGDMLDKFTVGVYEHATDARDLNAPPKDNADVLEALYHSI